MFNIGPQELLVVLIVALIIVGPKRLPELGRTIGRALNEFRKIQDEVKDMVKFDLGADPVEVEDPIMSGSTSFSDPHEFDPEAEADEEPDEGEESGGDDGGPAEREMTHSERVIAAMADDEVDQTDPEPLPPLDEVEAATGPTPPPATPPATAAD